MKTIKGTHFISREHPELLRDESSLSGGNCQCAAWPRNESEAAGFFKECVEDRVQMTISGARTGIAGGAVPMGGAVLSTEKLLGISPTETPGKIRVMSGETLESVSDYCRTHMPEYFYPPDPTETTASIGGTIATDASGSSSYMYGSTRKWVDRIELVLPSGKIIWIKRGEYRFIHGRLTHPDLGILVLPLLSRPQPKKNAAGLYLQPEMDLIDLFIGSEGELGLILSADLILARKPFAVATLAIFCDEDQFWALRDDLMNTLLPVRELEAMVPPCLEFLDRNSEQTAYPEKGDWVLITSIEACSETDLDTVLEALSVMLEERGVSPDSTWGGFDQTERKKLKDFRHTLPETVNRIISGLSMKNPSIHKISTDTAVAPEKLRDYLGYMNRVLQDAKVEHVVFGHCGQGHLHANLIPKDRAELESSERAVELLAEQAVLLGGTVSAEHGTGKLKKHLLKLMYSENELRDTELLKRQISRV